MSYLGLEYLKDDNIDKSIKKLLNKSNAVEAVKDNYNTSKSTYDLKGRAGSMKQPNSSLVITNKKFIKGI